MEAVKTKVKEYHVKSTRCDDFIEIRISNIFGNCIIHRTKDVAQIIHFTACGDKKSKLLQRVVDELKASKIVAYVNPSDLRVFTEQGFEITDEPVVPMNGYRLEKLTIRMMKR